MKRTKIIPFDWEYYQANKDKCRVITSYREPIEITQLTKFECEDSYCLIGIGENKMRSWKLENNDLQLELTEEVVESWANVYERIDGMRFTGSTFTSFEEALLYKDDTSSKYIRTLPLHELKEDEA